MTDSAPPSAGTVAAAAEALKAAIDRHLAAVTARSGEEDPAVQDAYEALRAAAEHYDDVLFDVYDEVTPFELAEPEAAAGGDGPAEELDEIPETVSVLLRRDYDLVDAPALVAAGRVARAEVDGAAQLPDDDGDDDGVGAAVYHLVHAYGVDGLHVRAEDIGLEPTGGTMWLLDEVAGDIDEDPFGGVDDEKLRLRLDELYAVDPPL